VLSFPTMKTTLVPSLLALLAFSSAVPLHAEAVAPTISRSTSPMSPKDEIAVDSVAARIHANGDSVDRGASRIMVRMRLGAPSAVLPDGSWLFRGYNARSVPRPDDRSKTDGDVELVGSGTLIVRFISEKVSSLSLADEPTIIALRQKPKTDNKNTNRYAAE